MKKLPGFMLRWLNVGDTVNRILVLGSMQNLHPVHLQSSACSLAGECRENRRMRSPPRRDYFSGGGPRGGPPMEEEPTRRVYVHNLSYKTSWQV